MTDKKPARVIRFGCVRASIWHTFDGSESSHHVTFRCHFKQLGAWYDKESFDASELPLLARAAELALAWIYSQPRSVRQVPPFK